MTEDHTDIYLDLSDQTTPLIKSLVNILSKSNLVNFSKIIKLWLIFIIFIQRDQYLQVESHMWKPFKKPTVRIGGNFTLSVRLPFHQGSELLSFEYFE